MAPKVKHVAKQQRGAKDNISLKKNQKGQSLLVSKMQ